MTPLGIQSYIFFPNIAHGWTTTGCTACYGGRGVLCCMLRCQSGGLGIESENIFPLPSLSPSTANVSPWPSATSLAVQRPRRQRRHVKEACLLTPEGIASGKCHPHQVPSLPMLSCLSPCIIITIPLTYRRQWFFFSTPPHFFHSRWKTHFSAGKLVLALIGLHKIEQLATQTTFWITFCWKVVYNNS